MSTVREGKTKPKTATEPVVLSWEEKKRIADKEAEVLEKQIEDLKTWTNMIDSMDEDQLMEYLRNRPEELKTVKIHKHNSKPRIQRAEKSKCSTSNGIMASVWKFHKEDDQEEQMQLSKF